MGDGAFGRGFARVTDRAGTTLIHARDARDAQRLTLHFGDGAVNAEVEEAGKRRALVESKPRKSYIAPQPGLFDAPEE